MSDLEAIRERAAREETERREAEAAEREARRMQALLNEPVSWDWSRYRSPADMPQGAFSAWVDAGKPRLGPPPPPPAPPKREVQFSEELMLQLADAGGRVTARAIAQERAKVDEKLAGLHAEIERLRGEIGQLRAEATVERALANDPPRRRPSTARRGSASPQH